MKKYLVFLVVMLSLSVVFGQAPENFAYQGVARQSSGLPLSNTSITVKITLLEGTTQKYVETHTVTTNKFGLYSLEIGGGAATTGVFSSLNWATSQVSVKVAINGTDIGGTQRLLSVPYALYANNSGSSGNGLITEAEIVNEELVITEGANVKKISLANYEGLPKPTSSGYLYYDNTSWKIQTITGGTVNTDSQDLIVRNDSLVISGGNRISLATLFPAVSTADNGKVLKVINGVWAIGDDLNDGSGVSTVPTLESVLQKSNNANGNVITNLGTPTNDNDASTKKYVDDRVGTIVFDDNDPNNEVQGLELDGDKLKITSNASATEIDLGSYKELPLVTSTESGKVLKVDVNGLWAIGDDLNGGSGGTDNQELTLSTDNKLSIEDGNEVDLSSLKELPTTATDGQVLKRVGGVWVAGVDDVGLAGAGIEITGNQIKNIGDIDGTDDVLKTTDFGGDVSGTYDAIKVEKIQGNTVSGAVPSNNEVLVWDGNQWKPAQIPVAGIEKGADKSMLVTNSSGVVQWFEPKANNSIIGTDAGGDLKVLTVGNGVTHTSNGIKLGGTLIEETKLDLNGKNFIVNGDGDDFTVFQDVNFRVNKGMTSVLEVITNPSAPADPRLTVGSAGELAQLQMFLKGSAPTADGNVLTTDKNGLASWQPVSSGGSVTASNGLTKTGSGIKLGGGLVEDTKIGLGGKNLSVNGQGKLNFEINPVSGAVIGSTGLTLGHDKVSIVLDPNKGDGQKSKMHYHFTQQYGFQIIGNGNNASETDGVGSNFTISLDKSNGNAKFKGDKKLAIDMPIIIPANAGDDKVLTSDANGNASWKLPSSGVWTSATGGINYGGGRVGIGIQTPSEKLHVEGSFLVSKSGGGDFKIAHNGTVSQIITEDLLEIHANGGGEGFSIDDVDASFSTVLTLEKSLVIKQKSVSSFTDGSTIPVNSSGYLFIEKSANNLSLSNGGYDGQLLYITISENITGITLNADNISQSTSSTITLGPKDSITFIWDGDTWVELYRSNNVPP